MDDNLSRLQIEIVLIRTLHCSAKKSPAPARKDASRLQARRLLESARA